MFITRLLCAKARVASLKNLNLARLELCAAQLLANLYQRIQTLDNGFAKSITNTKDWKHVSSSDNPADFISRGMSASNMMDSNFGWRVTHGCPGEMFLGQLQTSAITPRKCGQSW